MPINTESRIWEGIYQSFSEIEYDCDVFEESVWAGKLKARAQRLMDEARSGGAVSAVTTTSDYALPFFTAAVSRRGVAVRILDFGGGLGTSFIPLRRMLPVTTPLEFVVVENQAVCALGRATFAAEQEIEFVTEIPTGRSFDIVHAGSSLHYVDRWRETIQRFADTRANFLLFADLPAGDIKTFVTAQAFHGRRIPVRFWNIDEFAGCVTDHGYEMIFRAAYTGYYMQRDEALPTSHFDAEHRLNQFCQLVFRRTQGK